MQSIFTAPARVGADTGNCPTAWYRTPLALVTSLMLMIGCLGVGLGAPQSALAHDATSNGCTTPVNVPYWNDRFHSQCDTHDHCYNEKWYGPRPSGKAACDNRFYREMRGNCGRNVVCQGVAYTYYLAVRNGGWYAWTHSSWFH